MADYIVNRYPLLEGYVVGTTVPTVSIGGYWVARLVKLKAMPELLAASIVPINFAGPRLPCVNHR